MDCFFPDTYPEGKKRKINHKGGRCENNTRKKNHNPLGGSNQILIMGGGGGDLLNFKLCGGGAVCQIRNYGRRYPVFNGFSFLNGMKALCELRKEITFMKRLVISALDFRTSST